MSQDARRENSARHQRPPAPTRIGPAPTWIIALGAVFGAITLLGLFAFAFLAGTRPDFVCNSFTILATVFALGAALSAGFIGGAASIAGNLGASAKNNALAFSAGGGIAVLFIAFYAFQQFQPSACEARAKDMSQLSEDLSKAQNELERLKRQDIKIIPSTSNTSLPLKNIIIKYTDKNGETQPARHVKNAYIVSLTDLLSPGEIFVEYNPSTVPAERQRRGQSPPSIAIDRLSYSIDPLQLRLWLELPKPN
jgi:hypothetical protein